jgi:hypothetical protein
MTLDSSSLMPQPHGVRGGWRATFTSAVLEYTMRAGFTGHGPSTLTEHTAGGERAIDLPTASPHYAAMIDHVLACLTGHADNLIEPASVLPALELTLDVHQRLARLTSQPRVRPAGLCSLLAIILIGAIMCRTKITVQRGAGRHPKDAEAAGRSALDGDLGRLKAGAPGGWPFPRKRARRA